MITRHAGNTGSRAYDVIHMRNLNAISENMELYRKFLPLEDYFSSLEEIVFVEIDGALYTWKRKNNERV